MSITLSTGSIWTLSATAQDRCCQCRGTRGRIVIENALDLLQAIERPDDVFNRERATGMEVHGFSQVKARGAVIGLLPTCREPRLEREVLPEAQQWIEGEVGKLKRSACELLMGIKRGWIGVICHAQRLGVGGGKRGAHCKRK